MNLYSHAGHDHSEEIAQVVNGAGESSSTFTYAVAIGAVILFVGLVVAILVAKSK